jgi:hypothetical protein
MDPVGVHAMFAGFDRLRVPTREAEIDAEIDLLLQDEVAGLADTHVAPRHHKGWVGSRPTRE